MITYNHEKYIAEAIEGVLMQEVDFEVEFIIADDCSTDQTGEIVQKYIDHHPKGNWIKYTRHQINMGMMPNFFWALGECRGKYIALCDGDDFWKIRNKISKQVGTLEKNLNYSFSFHDCDVIDDQGNLIASSRVPEISKRNLNKRSIRYGSFVPTSTIVFRKEFLPPLFNINLSNAYNGDTIVLFFLSLKGPAYYEKEFLASSYRKHNDGVWSILDEDKKVERSLKTYELLRKSLKISEKKKLDEFLCFIYYELAKKQSNKTHLIKALRSSYCAKDLRIFIYSIIKFFTLK